MSGDPPERPKPRSRNRIGPEDRALWQKAMRDAMPLDPGFRDSEGTGGSKDAAPSQTPKRRISSAPLGRTMSGQARRVVRPTGPAEPASRIISAPAGPSQVGRPEPGLDRRNAERLRRGERAPDARIDLHGMTAERAHGALDRFIGRALSERRRLVLVITGKGAKSRDEDAAPFMRPETGGGEGVLRQQVPRWLRSGPHARRIVGIYQAHARHGGAGALYIYLKKDR